jgi:hypothetical protein
MRSALHAARSTSFARHFFAFSRRKLDLAARERERDRLLVSLQSKLSGARLSPQYKPQYKLILDCTFDCPRIIRAIKIGGG